MKILHSKQRLPKFRGRIIVFDIDGTLLDFSGYEIHNSSQIVQRAKDDFDFVIYWTLYEGNLPRIEELGFENYSPLYIYGDIYKYWKKDLRRLTDNLDNIVLIEDDDFGFPKSRVVKFKYDLEEAYKKAYKLVFK